MDLFKNKVAWVTGASSGIGEALVHELAKRQVKVILSSRNENELKRVRAAAKLDDTNSLILPLDLTDTTDIAQLCNKALERFGKIDLLFNNGGISQRAYANDTSLETDRKIMETNYFGQIALTKCVLPFMRSQKSGHIVVVSSISGKFGFYLRSAYSASKHALHGFFDSLRMEIHADNVKVLLICPGKIRTNISVNAIGSGGKKHGKMDKSQEHGMSAERCVVKILRAIESGKQEIYVGSFKERAALWMKRFFPKWFSVILRKQEPE